MPSAAEYAEMPVRITRDAVYIGDEKIPGAIAADGVVVLKAGLATDSNLLRITFLVGEVTAEDPWVTAKNDGPVTHYSSRNPNTA